jgi:1-acyl-sn-glycerol-3-phosphate acyltransferase
MAIATPIRSRALSLVTVDLWERYFRFEIEGFETLRTAEPSLIVGYHGGPWAYDLFILAARMHEELGYFPGAVWHPLWLQLPAVREIVGRLGGRPGLPRAADVAAMKRRGEHFVITPGGTHEGLRPFWEGRRVDFGDHRGYLRFAQAHELPVIPVVASGLDKTYLGLNHARAVSQRVFGRQGAPAWLGLGVGGLWPLAPPFPVKIRQRIGEPIEVSSVALEEAHARVTGTMQSMLDDLRRAA